MVKTVTITFVLAFSIALTEGMKPGDEVRRIMSEKIDKCRAQKSFKEGLKTRSSVENKHCFMACVFKDLQVIKDGTYNPYGLYDLIMTKQEKDEGSLVLQALRQVGEDCEEIFDEAADDECELAYKIAECFHINEEFL